jgi:prophage maintenance system killer protein
MSTEHGEIIIYQAEDGRTSLEVHLQEESVWLTQKQLSSLFETERSVITKHINNIFRTGELDKSSVCAKFAHTAADGKTYRTKYYNLDVIIAVGYRVNAKRGTQFRTWATNVLKQHLIKGYTANEKRLAEKGLSEMEQAVALLARTLQRHELVDEQGKAVLEVVSRYARSWSLLLQYDEDRLALPKGRRPAKKSIDYQRVREAVAALKDELIALGEAGDLFGQERGQSLQAILGNIDQTFGRELYPSAEEKAAHLLYFVIKDHPFSDGNKRIGSFLFLLFLRENRLLEQSGINENGLVALALLIAESHPQQKELVVRLVINLIAGNVG